MLFRSKEIGGWMSKYGETIYGTRGGPVTARSWGVTTQIGEKVFVHDLSGETHLLIPNFDKRVRRVSILNDGTSLKFEQNDIGIAVQVPEQKIDPTDTILELSL